MGRKLSENPAFHGQGLVLTLAYRTCDCNGQVGIHVTASSDEKLLRPGVEFPSVAGAVDGILPRAMKQGYSHVLLERQVA
ncbi:MAG: hypothetical protein KDJ50_03350 [Alphaproteobacteria bacterium]|nr:hypothetical protein [Alphaproteobacteria bacterium]